MVVTLDESLLERHRSFVDRRQGFQERFVELDLEGGSTLGVLSAPLSEPEAQGWVLCHSFGTEQTDLQSTEVSIARGLARAGFPILRFHCQGYGDSSDLQSPPSLASHVRDTTQAVRSMPEICGVPVAGLVGARVGGTVAAIVAGRLGLPYVVLIAPVVNGARYINEQLRSRIIAEMVKGSEDPGASTIQEARNKLERGEAVSIKGWPLVREVYEEMRRVDLLKEPERFAGDAAIIQVSRGPSPHESLERLRDRLSETAASAVLHVVTDPHAAHFGYEHFQSSDRRTLVDSLHRLNQALTRVVTEWVRQAGRSRPPLEGDVP